MTISDIADFKAFYDDLTLHVVPGPRSLSYFIPFLLMPVALLIPPSRMSHRQMQWTFVPVCYAVQLHVWVKHRSFDVISMNHALVTFMLLGWYDARNDFRYLYQMTHKDFEAKEQATSKEWSGSESDVAEETTKAQAELPSYDSEAYPTAFWPRVKWVVLLCSSLRLTWWHIGLQSHDARQPSFAKPFKSFFLNTIANTVLTYVLLNISSQFVSYECDPSNTTTVGRDVCLSSFRALLLLTRLYAALTLLTWWLPSLLVLIFLALFPSLQQNSMISPLTWPSHFGPVTSIWAVPTSRQSPFGLRAFWGVFWHQNMRHMTSTPGFALASWLGLSSGSLTRYMIVVSSSFFWSGIVHMGIVPPEPVGTSMDVMQLRLWLASFFWIQIVGIGIEIILHHYLLHDIVQKKRGDSDKVRWWIPFWQIAVFAWTVGFLALTTWCFIRPVGCELNWWKLNIPSFSYPVWLTRLVNGA